MIIVELDRNSDFCRKIESKSIDFKENKIVTIIIIIIIIIIIQERQSDAIEKIYRVDGSHIKRSNRKNSQLYGE